MGFDVTELHIDRGYLPAEAVHDRRREGMRLVSKPPSPNSKRKRFSKADFDVDAAFLYPWALIFREIGWGGFFAMGAFIAVLAVGDLYAWKIGALDS